MIYYNFSEQQFYILFTLLILFLERLYLLMLSQVEYFYIITFYNRLLLMCKNTPLHIFSFPQNSCRTLLFVLISYTFKFFLMKTKYLQIKVLFLPSLPWYPFFFHLLYSFIGIGLQDYVDFCQSGWACWVAFS